jgi:hypothetical protein
VWALANRTPYAAARNWTRDEHGVHWWLVAVRATFTISTDGRLALLDEQPPPVLTPEHYGEPGKSSLRYDSDLLARKPSTDVLVLGTAYAPGGQPADSVPVLLRIASIDKTLVVHGERAYRAGLPALGTTAPRPFSTTPIRYELAFGGPDDERNPIGRGYVRHNASLGNTLAHQIEYPRGNPAKVGPAGFGPIDPSWLPRRALAGTYDAAWARHKKPLLPDDYQATFAMSAPADQQTQQPLRGGERLALVNLSSEGSLLVDVPHIRLELHSRFGRTNRPHDPPLLSTLLVEPDERRLSVVWQSALRVAAPEADYLDETTIIERAGA